MWSGGLIDSRSVVGVYICHLGRHSDACWRGGNCVCCHLADASFGIRIVHKLLIGIDIFALHNEKTSWNIDHDVNMYTDGLLK